MLEVPPLPAPSPVGWLGKPVVGMLANRRGQLRTPENSGKGEGFSGLCAQKLLCVLGATVPAGRGGPNPCQCWRGGHGPPGWLQPMLRGAKPSWQTAHGGVRLGSGEAVAQAETEHCARAVPSHTARRSCKGCSGDATRQGLALPLTLSARQVKECEALPGVTTCLCACRETLAGWLCPPRALSLLEPPLPPCSQGSSSCRDPLWEV